MLFIYKMESIDCFRGMTLLRDYIRLCLFYSNEEHSQYLSFKELKSFLIKCFIHAKSHHTGWEGDIRGLDEIAISAVPSDDWDARKLIAFKQDNNGSSFIVSECLLYKYDDSELVYAQVPLIKNHVSSDSILQWFDESYELTEELFAHALDSTKDISVKNNSTNISLNDFQQI